MCQHSSRRKVIGDEDRADCACEPAIRRDERQPELRSRRRDDGVTEAWSHAACHEPRRTMSDLEARSHETDLGRPEESVDRTKRVQADAVRTNEQLARTHRADDAFELSARDVAEQRVNGRSNATQPRALDVVDERPGVRDERFTEPGDRSYERFVSGHGPRSSSTYASGSPPYAPRSGLASDAKNSPHVIPSGGENATRSTSTAPGPNGIVSDLVARLESSRSSRLRRKHDGAVPAHLRAAERRTVDVQHLPPLCHRIRRRVVIDQRRIYNFVALLVLAQREVLGRRGDRVHGDLRGRGREARGRVLVSPIDRLTGVERLPELLRRDAQLIPQDRLEAPRAHRLPRRERAMRPQDGSVAEHLLEVHVARAPHVRHRV